MWNTKDPAGRVSADDLVRFSEVLVRKKGAQFAREFFSFLKGRAEGIQAGRAEAQRNALTLTPTNTDA